ncbi:MAG TPA: hypothetical protein VN238_23260 [Solirubrobacteraceae bacterium]|nr:hypothetical protein [Solirubrobacteraceae bacterium]
MSADRGDRPTTDAERDLERGGEEMQHDLAQVEEHLDEAKKAAANPPMEPDAGVSGDWEGEATGSSQGEDAEDATGDSGEGESQA